MSQDWTGVVEVVCYVRVVGGDAPTKYVGDKSTSTRIYVRKQDARSHLQSYPHHHTSLRAPRRHDPNRGGGIHMLNYVALLQGREVGTVRMHATNAMSKR